VNHRTLAVIDFAVAPWLADTFLTSVQFGSKGTWDTKGEAWDLAVELVLSKHKRLSFTLEVGTAEDPFRPGSVTAGHWR